MMTRSEFMKKASLIAASTALVWIGMSSHTAWAQNRLTEQFGVSLPLSVEDAVTLELDGDLVIDQAYSHLTTGDQYGCLTLTKGPSFEISLTSRQKPYSAEYFYMRSPNNWRLRYIIGVGFYSGDESPSQTVWSGGDKSGRTRQITVADEILNDQSDRCGAGLPLYVFGTVYNGTNPAAEDIPLSNVFQDTDSMKPVIPPGEHIFSDTVTITLSPVFTS